MAISTANLDAGTDDPRQARSQILEAVQRLNELNAVAKALASFGSLANNGTNDDAAVLQAAAASGERVIDARGVNCRVNSQINIPSGQTWLLHGAALSIASSTQTLFNADTVNDWSLLGPFKITGDGSTVGTAKALRVKDCARWLIDAPLVSSIKGWAFYLEPGSSTTPRAAHGTLRHPIFHTCYYGYEDVAGTGAEYCTVDGPRIYGCAVHGLKTAAGNTLVKGGHIIDNTALGVHLVSGANHGHGGMIGTNINHNGSFGLKAEQVLNGFTFDGCHLYQNDIWLDRSKGIHLLGGHLDAKIYNYKDGSSGLNLVDGCYCPNTYGIARMVGSNDGHDQLIMRNLWGPGAFAVAGGKDGTGIALNDPALVYVLAERQPGASQALTSGADTTLIWPTEVFDRRAAYDNATGLFTVPAGQAGTYRIRAQAIIAGASITADLNYVDLQVNGASKRLFFPVKFNPTKYQVPVDVDMYLNAGDVVRLRANFTGTTLVFNDATWMTWLSIERIG